MSSKSKPVLNLSWNDRFALINQYQPSDKAICSSFGVSPDELSTARQLYKEGTFIATPDLDVAAYKDVFGETIKKPNQKTANETSISKTVLPPQTATKATKTPKKRGRKGDKITNAFMNVSPTPVPAEAFAKQYDISLFVLRQGKRFDPLYVKSKRFDPSLGEGLGRVRVKKDSETKQLMVWREPLPKE